ncbi:hypothetical protein Patl1_18628 [Pistacia atlantica]|uniref:Uncharacterized protein n=1 Tax=Pistacia atlantica TaxID=434234 RepID=A0ACC1BYS4_9ROSI|nr:hypothetical protein Patl1_18628 [Pistacia atlantica]
MKRKNLQKVVTEDSLMKNVSVLLEEHLEEKNIESGEIQTCENASCKDGGSLKALVDNLTLPHYNPQALPIEVVWIYRLLVRVDFCRSLGLGWTCAKTLRNDGAVKMNARAWPSLKLL